MISSNVAQTISNGQSPTINVTTDPSNLAAINAKTANYLATRNALLSETSNPDSKIQNSRNSNATGGLVFPSDIGKYMIKLQLNEYTRANITDGASLSGGTSIFLPIPANLIDSQSLKWSEDSLGTGVGAIYNTAKNATGFSQGITDLKNAANNWQGAKNFAGATALGAAQAAGGTISSVGQAIRAITGQSPNPYLIVTFDNPVLKTHQFQWKFSPQSAAETATLATIINNLKQASLPVDNGPLLGFPKVITMKLFPSSTYMYDFKPCVIENITINYAPSGVPSFFAGMEAPAEIELVLSMKEIEIWTSGTGTFSDESIAEGFSNLGKSIGNVIKGNF